MPRNALAFLVLATLIAVPAGLSQAAEKQANPGEKGDQHWALLDKYCTECHNAIDWAGGVAFDTLTPASVPDEAKTFEAAVRKAIEVLLENGALVDLPNAMGVTPFMAAAGLGVSIRDPRGNYDGDAQSRVLPTLEILLKAGADVNARVTDTSGHTARIARPSTMTNRQGQTALYGAINWGWTKVVKFLLDNGARVDIADAAGKTPLDATKGNAGGRDYKATQDVMALIGKAAAGTKT